jgi:hypothetical protein
VTEERSPAESTENGATGPTGDAVEQQPQSVEDVEAFWRNRFSSRDRAHNAETAALKAQIAALQTAPATPPAGETPEAARIRELEAALQQANTARQAEALRSQYPMASAVLGDATTNVPPATLAAIEAAIDRGESPVQPRVDPNMAPRGNSAIQPQAAKPVTQKTKDELLGDLRRLAGPYQEALKEGLL